METVTPSNLGETIRAVSLPVLTGLLVRAIPVVTSDFPLNDGGLFYAMTRDLQRANFLLPATTSYNGLDIPFAYPPLAFYLAGILSSVLGIGLLDIFRFLPLILATLMIPAVYLVARELLATRFQALIATWAFAFLPRSFDWLIAGGGVTRSLGMLLAILAILEGIRFYKTNQRRHAVGLALLAGLTALSHPEAALFASLSMVLVLLTYARTWRALRDSIALAALAAIVAAPWWLTVIARDGIGPFLSGGQTGEDLLSTLGHLLPFAFTDEPYGTFLAVLGFIGLVHQVAAGRYLLPAWIVLLFVLDPRAAPTETMMPLAMLIAIALDEVLLARVARHSTHSIPGPFWPTDVVRDRFGRTLLAAALVLGVVGAVKASGGIGSPLHALGASNRAAMAWIGANAPPTTEFLVVTGSGWHVDANSEWFPVLTDHHSLATVQGYEWLGKDAWDRQRLRNYRLQLCLYGAASCIQDWTRSERTLDAWLYLPRETIDTFSTTGDCCGALRSSLVESPAYDVMYSGPGGTIFRPKH